VNVGCLLIHAEASLALVQPAPPHLEVLAGDVNVGPVAVNEIHGHVHHVLRVFLEPEAVLYVGAQAAMERNIESSSSNLATQNSARPLRAKSFIGWGCRLTLIF